MGKKLAEYAAKKTAERIADMRIFLNQQYNRGRSQYIFAQLDDGTVIVVDRYGPDFQKLTSRFDMNKFFTPESK